MNAPNFEDGVERILTKTTRYHRDGYFFLREALDFTQRRLAKGAQNRPSRHVTGQELLDGIRLYALDQFGPMAITVLDEWGIRSCADFGEMVFEMIEVSLLAKTERDSRDDFREGFNFEAAFRAPFKPAPARDTRIEAKRDAE